MAALAQSIDAANTVVSSAAFEASPGGTEWRVADGPPSFSETGVPRLTSVVSDNPVKLPIASSPEVAEMQIGAPAQGLKFVDAVIGEIRRETVVITCFTGSGEVEINLPAGMIPAQLLSFGAPVRLSLDENFGYRVPKIEARAVAQQGEITGQAEFESWLDAL